MAGLVGARLWPGARQWGVCTLGVGGLVLLPSPSPPCPSVPFRRPALPVYPLRTRSVGLGWTVGLGVLTWCFFFAGRRGLGSFLGLVARVVCRATCTVSWASCLLFTGVHALCVVLRVRCPGPLGSCSPVCTLCVWCCVYGVLGLLAPVHRRARPVCGVACTVSWASWLLLAGVRALCVVLCARYPGPLGSSSPVCAFCVWCCVYGVLGLLAPVHRCAHSVCGVLCTVSGASWLLFTSVHTLFVVLRARCPGPLGSCSPVCTLCVWCCVYGVLDLLAPVHRCACSVCGVACTVSWASWLLFTGVHALCVVLRVRCPGPPGSCWPLCALCVWCCVHGILGRLAPLHRCARSVSGVVCTVSWASWLLFTGVHTLSVVFCVRCPGPPWLLFTSVHTLFVVLRVRCPRPLGSCSPVCTLCVWCCVYGVLDLLAPVHRCACSVCGVACTVSWASWLLFTGVRALCVVLRVRCPGYPGSCSLVCTPCVWCCGCGVLGRLVPVHRCARSVCGVVCAVSWAAWLLCTGVPALVCCVVCTASWAPWLRFTGVHALCAVSCASSPGPFGPFLLVCSCVVCCVAFVVSWDSWFVFSGVAVCCGVCGVRCAVLRVRCPGPPGPCSPVRTPRVWCCVGGVLGRVAPVHQCAYVVCYVMCLVSWASWLPFSGVSVLCVAWCVRCPGPLGSRSPVCPCGLCCVACSVSWASWLLFTGVLCACLVCCVFCAVSWATGSCSLMCLLGVLPGVCWLGEGVCSRVPYRPRCIFRRAQE